MIITKQKPLDDIAKALCEGGSAFLVGCGDCATLCHTGGEKELDEMARALGERNIEVTGKAVVNAPCHELDTKRVLRQHKDEVASADSILVMTCGAGVQAVGDNSEKPTVSGCDSMFIGNSRRHMHFYEKCSACGECVLNFTAGLCPETRCPKSLINGPCGGASGGKCEVDSYNNCVWIEIYERMKKFGRLDDLMEIVPPKNNIATVKPHRVEEPARSARPAG